MLIGFDGSRAFVNNKTGTENYSYQILKNLAKIDTENNYIVYVRPGFEKPEEDWPDNFQFRLLNYPRLWTQLGLAQATFKDKIEVLFVPAHTLPLVHRKGLKAVMTVHDLGAEYLPTMHQLKQRLYLNFITNHQLKGATKLIAVSGATKDDLIKRAKINPEKITVIYEGIDLDFYQPTKEEETKRVLDKFGLERHRYFFFIGTIQPRKNLERLIEAFARWVIEEGNNQKRIKLVLAGGKGWLSENIYQLAPKLGLEDSVRFIGKVSDIELKSLYSGALALVFPSLFEGFGLPILEAMSCGCPVLTSEISSMPEVGGKAALYVDPYNLSSIKDGLEKIMESDIRKKLIIEGQEQVKKFSWEKAARETLKVLEEVCNQ